MVSPNDIVFPSTLREEIEARVDDFLRRPWTRRERSRRFFLPEEWAAISTQIVQAYETAGWTVDIVSVGGDTALRFSRPARSK